MTTRTRRLMPYKPMKVAGHRGASDSFPENTRQSIREAFEGGADGAEFDVQLSKDSQVVVIHDDTLRRTAIPSSYPEDVMNKKIWELPYSVIKSGQVGNEKGQEPPPLLNDILKLQENYANQSQEKELFIEVKGGDTRMVTPLVETLKSFSQSKIYKKLLNLWTVIAFDKEVLSLIKQVYPEIKTAWVLEAKDSHASSIATAKDEGFNGIDFESSESLSRELVQKAKSAGLRVLTWVHGDKTDGHRNALKLRNMGVDVFTSNMTRDMYTSNSPD